MYVSCIELNINSIRVCKNNKNLIILKITLRYINKLYMLYMSRVLQISRDQPLQNYRTSPLV